MEDKSLNIVQELGRIISVLMPYRFSNRLFFKWGEHLKTLDDGDKDFEIEREIITLLSSKNLQEKSSNELEARPLAFLLLFVQKNKEIADFHDLKNLQLLEQEIKTVCNSTTLDEANNLFEDFLELIEVDKTRALVKVKRSLSPLYFLISYTLIFLFLHNFAESTTLKEEFIGFFLMTSAIATAAFSRINNYFTRRYNKRQLSSFNQSVKIKMEIGYRGYILFAFISILILGIVFIVAEDAFVFVSIFVILLPTFFILSASEARLPVSEIRYSMMEDIDLSFTIDEEENDNVIVLLESKVSAFNSRLEAYVLESALFGALAFSGFLTIMAEDLITFDQFEIFTQDAFQFVSGLLLFELESVQQLALKLSTKQSTFMIVSIISLMSSLFFMVVIASRLRLSSILDQTKRFLNLAVVYNDKENDLDAEESSSKTKFADYNRKITEYLRLAYHSYLQIDDISSFMLLFRASGVISFFIVLITSALLVSNFLSLVFIVLSLVIIIFFNKKEIEDFWKSLTFNLRIRLYNNLHLTVVFALLILAVTAVINYYNQSLANYLLFVTVLLFISYRFLALYVVKRSSISKQVEKMKGVRLSWLLAEIFIFLSLYFWVLKLPGASIVVVFGILFLSIVAINVLKVLIENRYLSVAIIINAIIINLGLMFKVLHLPGANLFVFIGVILSVILLILQLILKIKIMRLELYFLYIFALVMILPILPDQYMISYQAQVLDKRELSRLVELNDDLRGMNRGMDGNPTMFEQEISTLKKDVEWYAESYPAMTTYKEGLSSQLMYIATNYSNRKEEEMKTSQLKQLINLSLMLDPNIKNSDLYKEYMTEPPFGR